MTILLLGKDGQVGWQLQRSLAPHGEVIACGRERCDLSDPNSVGRLIRDLKPKAVVNAAAYTAVDKAESDEKLAMLVNAISPAVMAEECSRLGALLVHYSTDYVFSGDKAEGAYVEADLNGPQSVYGRSKLAGEEAIRAAGGKSIIFRTSWVFGARGGNFVKTILRLARERERLTVVNDQIGSPTPAAMISTVTGLVLAMMRCGALLEKGENRLYHLAAANPVSWYEFACSIVRNAHLTPGFDLKLVPEEIHPIPSSDYPTPARRPLNSRLDCSKLEGDFGLSMPDWEPYLQRMLQLLALKQNGY